MDIPLTRCLLALSVTFISSRLFLPGISPRAPAALEALPLWPWLHCASGGPWPSVLWLDVVGASSGKAQQRRQLLVLRRQSSCSLSFQSCLIICCAQRWLYSSPCPSFSSSLGAPNAFHLGAVTQGLGHLSSFPSGLLIDFLCHRLEWFDVKYKTQASREQGLLPFWLWSDFLSEFQVQPRYYVSEISL